MSVATDVISSTPSIPPASDLEALRQQLQAAQTELQQARQDITQLERRQKIDALLAEADSVDLQAARLLTEAAVQGMEKPDLELAVADLRRHKPYLFRRRAGSSGGGAMAPRLTDSAAPQAQQAAEQASVTGNRRDLLRYLRLRRKN